MRAAHISSVLSEEYIGRTFCEVFIRDMHEARVLVNRCIAREVEL